MLGCVDITNEARQSYWRTAQNWDSSLPIYRIWKTLSESVSVSQCSTRSDAVLCINPSQSLFEFYDWFSTESRLRNFCAWSAARIFPRRNLCRRWRNRETSFQPRLWLAWCHYAARRLKWSESHCRARHTISESWSNVRRDFCLKIARHLFLRSGGAGVAADNGRIDQQIFQIPIFWDLLE